ncbi:MAG: flagellin lysine-N-methylase, partial [Clostridia bacterium]|nr:flagellin lysine-N-methylase [Clostridia bacterium]
MKITKPDFYKDFHCIADRCRHSCCIGWEIDIDEDSLARYDTVPGPSGEKPRGNPDRADGYACFHLTGDEERCPFLKENGLCEMILTLGEDALCEICTEHPRFRNFFSEREEIGLGLCCEEACRILYSHKGPITLETEGNDGTPLDPWEKKLLSIREQMLEAAQVPARTFPERIGKLLALAESSVVEDDLPACFDRFFETLPTLEILDSAWRDCLAGFRELAFVAPAHPEYADKLLWYLIYRHISQAEDMEDLAARTVFVIASTYP